MQNRGTTGWRDLIFCGVGEVMISIVILTYNDEVQIENCLNSVANLSDDIVVIDSNSKDNTLKIC